MKNKPKGAFVMKTNKTESFNKTLPISKIPLFDIRKIDGEVDFLLSKSDIKTSASQQKIDSAVFTLPINADSGEGSQVYAAIYVPVFPPSEENPDSIMVMAARNTSRFFDVKFFKGNKANHLSELIEFEPNEAQEKTVINFIDSIENTILKNAAQVADHEYAYAESIKSNLFDKNNVEFFKVDLFKFSPFASSLSAETRSLLDNEVFLAKRNIFPSSDLGI